MRFLFFALFMSNLTHEHTYECDTDHWQDYRKRAVIICNQMFERTLYRRMSFVLVMSDNGLQ
jgi:hypothetical protein